MNQLIQLQAAVKAARAKTGDKHLGTQISKGVIDVIRAVPPESGKGSYSVIVLAPGLTVEQAIKFLGELQ